MATIAQLSVTFLANTVQYIPAINEVISRNRDFSATTDQGTSAISRMGDQARSTAAGLLGVATAAGGFGLGIKLAADAEQSRIAFTTMLGSAQKAQALMSQIAKFAAETPFEIPGLTAAAKSLVAFGVDAGQVIPTLRKLGDISAGINAPIGEIAELYGKARVQGRLFAMDVNQLTNRGIPVIQEFAKQFGVTENKVKELVEKGSVSFSHLQRAVESLTASGGQFAGLMAAQSVSVAGLFSTLRDSVTSNLRSMGEAFLSLANATLVMQTIIAMTDSLKWVFVTVGIVTGKLAGIVVDLVSQFQGLIKALPGLYIAFKVATAAIGYFLFASLKLLALKLAWWAISTAAAFAGMKVGALVLSATLGALTLATTVLKTAWVVLNVVLAGNLFSVIVIAVLAAAVAILWLFNGITWLKNKVAEFVGEAQTMATELFKIDAAAGGAAGRVTEMSDAMKRALSIVEELRTPIQVYDDRILELQAHLRAFRIDQDTFNRGVEQARAAFRGATPGMELTSDLREQIQTFGMASRAAEIFKAQVAGATPDVLSQAVAFSRQLDVLEANKKLIDETKQSVMSLYENSITPAEKFAKQVKEIALLQSVGAINATFAARARLAAEKELQDELRKTLAIQSPAAVERGSAAAFSAANQNRMASMNQKAVEKKLEEQRRIAAAHAADTRRLVDLARRQGREILVNF